MSKTSVEKVLEDMDSEEQHQAILSFMQYPLTSKLDKSDCPIVTCPYSCSEISCNFSAAKRAIKESVELRAFGAQPFLEQILADIDKYQEDHLARQVDGFQIYRGGFDLVRLQRLDEKGMPCTNTRTGFIEYNDVRQLAFEKSKRERQEVLDKAFHKSVGTAVDRCTIM